MLRMSYHRFVQDIETELKTHVGVPFEVKIDVRIGIPPQDDMKEKLDNWIKHTLQPIMDSVPKKVVM